MFRNSYDLQDPTNLGGGLGIEFDSGLDIDSSSIYGEEDPYFLYDNPPQPIAPARGNLNVMQSALGAAPFGGSAIDYSSSAPAFI